MDEICSWNTVDCFNSSDNNPVFSDTNGSAVDVNIIGLSDGTGCFFIQEDFNCSCLSGNYDDCGNCDGDCFENNGFIGSDC